MPSKNKTFFNFASSKIHEMYVSVHYVCGFPANHLTVLLSINMEVAGKLVKKSLTSGQVGMVLGM